MHTDRERRHLEGTRGKSKSISKVKKKRIIQKLRKRRGRSYEKRKEAGRQRLINKN